MEFVIPYLHPVRASVGDIFSAIRPRNRIAAGLHNRYEILFVCRPRHGIFNGADGLEFPTVPLDGGAVFSRSDGFPIEGLFEFRKHRELLLGAQAVADTAHLFNRIWTVIELHTACVADTIDNEMVVNPLPSLVIVGIQVRADKHLEAGKHLLGQSQTNAVGGVVIMDFVGHEGLLVVVVVHPAPLAVEILGGHEFLVGGLSETIYARQIAVSVLVKCLGILGDVEDDLPHRALGLFLGRDIITSSYRLSPHSFRLYRLQLCRQACCTVR